MDVYTQVNLLYYNNQTVHSNTTSSFLNNIHYHKADSLGIGMIAGSNMVLSGVKMKWSGAIKLEQNCII